MKKRTMISIIAIASALVLVMTCAYMCFFHDSTEKKNNGKSEVIFECNPENIKKISIAVGNYSYSLIKNENVWSLDGQEGKKLIDKSVQEALTVFSSIKGKEVSNVKDISFDTVVTVDKGIGKTVFKLAQKDNVYYLLDKKDKLYTVSQVVYSIAERDENFYRDKSVVSSGFLGQTKKSKFVSYNYKFNNNENEMKEINVRLKNSSEVKRYLTSSRYILDKPFTRSVDADAFERILEKLSKLEAKSFISDTKSEADLLLFGLDKASRQTLTVRCEDESFVIYIGNSVIDEGIVYCMLDNDNEVFTISEDALEFLDEEPYNIVEKTLFDFNRDNLRKISFSGSEINLDIVLDGINFSVGKTPVSKESFEEIYSKLLNVKITFIGTEMIKATDKLLDIEVSIADGSVNNYVIFKAANEKIFVSENDTLFFEIDKRQFNAFKEDLKSFEKIPI